MPYVQMDFFQNLSVLGPKKNVPDVLDIFIASYQYCLNYNIQYSKMLKQN